MGYLAKRLGLLVAIMSFSASLSVSAILPSESESASFGAREMFSEVYRQPGARAFSSVAREIGNAQGSVIFEDAMPDFKSFNRPSEQFSGEEAQAIKEVDLAPLLNRHHKTKFRYNLGGKDVWVSGTFDRSQNMYVVVLVDGEEAKFFNVKGLLDSPETLDIGAGTYMLSLAPNIVNKLASQIVLRNLKNKQDQKRISLNELIVALNAVGEEIKLSDQVYRLFYFDDMTDKSIKTFAFIFTDASNGLHVFLIPQELVLSDKMAVFKMYNNKRMGLQQLDGKLRVFDNI